MLTTLGGINESMIQIVGFFVLGMIIIESIIILASCEWLFLSFRCAVCKLDYSKALFFVLSLSYFQCPFCHRRYTILKKGDKCHFRRFPFDDQHQTVIHPFEVKWEKPFSRT